VSVVIVENQVILPKNVIKPQRQIHLLLDLLVRDKSPQEYVLIANVAVTGLMSVTHNLI
jgi:hypothetical protein